jgi:O-antigen/teichoic acid export membrane protein
MTLQRIWTEWKKDALIQRVLRNSGYLFSSTTISTAISMVQSILAARLLGAYGVGIVGAVTRFSSSISRLFSFRMGELVVKYVGQFLEQKETKRAAAVLRAAAFTETATSIFTFVIMLALAPLAATYIAKDPTTVSLFVFFGLSMLANLTTQTSTALLQVGNKFNLLAVVNLIQTVVTASIVTYAFFTEGTIWHVVIGYFAGKIVNGLLLFILALIHARHLLGAGWWRVSWEKSIGTKEFWRFALSSNFSATVNLVARDSEELWVSYFLSPLEAGYYKTALSVINLVMLPIDPFISTTYPEISGQAGKRAWSQLRGLLKKVTTISVAWTASVSLFLLIFGWWLIPFVYGAEFAPTTPVALVLLIGFAFANIFYWNRPLLLSLGLPTYPLKISALAGAGKVILSIVLVPTFGYLAQAGLMSAYFLTTVGMNIRRGFREITRREVEEGGEQ